MSGIIKAQVFEYSSGVYENLEDMKKCLIQDTEIWKKIFSLNEEAIKMKAPLTPKILSDPNHPFVTSLVYIYSM